MLNIGICDDNISTTGKLEMMLQRLGKAHFIDIETDVFWDGKNIADSVEAGMSYDIIYLDIEMNKECCDIT